MKLAVIGSRTLMVEAEVLHKYMPPQVTELVSGGAKGIDSCARIYAMEQNIPIIEFFPDHSRFGRAAPLKRNQQIAEYADEIPAFWDGQSKGTADTLRRAARLGKKANVVLLK